MTVPCQSIYTVNLAGNRLHARGAPFIQQDGQVAACATAAMWMSAIVESKRLHLDLPTRSMAEITQFATRYSLPSRGAGGSPSLGVDQVLSALRELGYDPLSYSSLSLARACELLYSYVSSGIPPILILGFPAEHDFHAVTVVGYSPTPARVHRNADPISLSMWRSALLVHDDQMGAYIRLTIGASDEDSRGLPTVRIDPHDPLFEARPRDVARWYHGARVQGIIVPMPPRHAIRSEQATTKGLEMLRRGYSLYANAAGKWPRGMFIRTRFLPSNDFKVEKNPSFVRGLSPDLAARFRGTDYSRYIWLVARQRVFDR